MVWREMSYNRYKQRRMTDQLKYEHEPDVFEDIDYRPKKEQQKDEPEYPDFSLLN